MPFFPPHLAKTGDCGFIKKGMGEKKCKAIGFRIEPNVLCARARRIMGRGGGDNLTPRPLTQMDDCAPQF